MNSFFDLLKLFYLNSKLKVLRGLQYRFDFLFGLFVAIGISSLGPILEYLFFLKMRGFPGWNLNQIILFQSTLLLWLGIKDICFGELRGNLETMIKGGGFDRLLLKPYPPIGIILVSGFYYQGFGTVIAGLVITSIALKRLGIIISLWQIGLFIILLMAGLLLYMTVLVFYCVIAIHLVHMGRLGEIIERILHFSQYPVDIYPQVIRLFALVVFPVAIWVYLPAQTLLNRIDIMVVWSLVGCVLLFLLSIKVWDLALKQYTSAGG